jgi:hypothetical protein
LSYFKNEVSDIYNDGKPAIVVNDVSNHYFGSTNIYEYADNKFILKDSTTESWIPAGTGDSNGDGIREIFLTGGGSGIVTQASSLGGNPLSNLIFKDIDYGNFWACGMYDFTGDKKEELIAYSDSAFMFYTYRNNKYELLDLAITKPGDKPLGTLQEAAIGDFDGDGRTELCHGDRYGNLFIWEYFNGKFTIEYKDTVSYSAGGNYFCSGDIDGDGKPEIITLGSGGKALFGLDEPAESIWTLRIYKSINTKEYSVTKEHIYGVRSGYISNLGFSYRNGIASSNVDNIAGDEIVVSTFPNLYIFKWDAIKQNLKPFWYYPSVFSNSAFVYDFDKNGINEIGFNGFDKMRFFEYQTSFKGPGQPTGFDGWAVNENSAYFRWNPVPDAEYYEVYNIINVGNQYIGIITAVTTQTNLSIDTLQNHKFYRFAVRAVNTQLPDTAGYFSNPIEVYTHKPLESTEYKVINRKTTEIKFDGKLPEPSIEISKFKIFVDGNSIPVIPVSALSASDSIAILIFAEDLPLGVHTLVIDSFRDYYRTPSKPSQLKIKIEDIIPEKELFLSRLNIVSKYKLVLQYSESVQKLSSENISNYILTPTGKIESVILNEPLPDNVTINISQNDPIGALGKDYSLKVLNVVASSGNLMTRGAGNTLSFVFSENILDYVFIYPNPIRLAENPIVYFANLTPEAEIEIFSFQGEQIRVINERDGNGGVEWDLRDKFGNYLSTGVYLYKVKGKDANGNESESSIKKFAIIK